MVEYKAGILISHEAYGKIRWFTENLNTEIGAVGTVKIKKINGNKYFYVEKLYFPKQEVSGATVHFTGEMWKDVIKQAPMEELGAMNFYWHLHPGSPGHSGVDEEDTFETFMGTEANRPYFVFLQTAFSDNKILKEARIDIRNPIRATILHNDINVLVERSPEEKDLEEKLKALREITAKECEKIKEEVIVKPTYSKGSGYGECRWGGKSREDWKSRTTKNYKDNLKYGVDIDNLKTMFENVEDEKLRFYIDNYFVVVNNISYSVDVEDEVSVEIKDGGVIVRAGDCFNQMLEGAIAKQDSELNKWLKPAPSKEPVTKDIVKYKLQPKAGSYEELCKEMVRMFLYFNSEVMKEIYDDEELLALEDGTKKELSEIIQAVNLQQPSGKMSIDEKKEEYKVSDNVALVSAILDVFDSIGMVQIAHQDTETTVGNVIDLVSDEFCGGARGDFIGGFIVSKGGKDISVHGNELIYILKAAGLAF